MFQYAYCLKCGKRPFDKLQLKITDFGVTRKMTADANRFSTAGNPFLIGTLKNQYILKAPTRGLLLKHLKKEHGQRHQMSGRMVLFFGNCSHERNHIKGIFQLRLHFR